MTPTRLFAAAILCAAVTCAPAAVLYKSVGTNGTVEFSDLPPEKGRNVERIRIPDSISSNSGAPTTLAAAPAREEQLQDADAAVGRANAQLDLAEHALAEARRSVSSGADPLRMVSARIGRADQERLEFYKKDVLLARQALLEALKEKRKAPMSQTYTASNEWVPVSQGARQ